jgi:hypothetical protein
MHMGHVILYFFLNMTTCCGVCFFFINKIIIMYNAKLQYVPWNAGSRGSAGVAWWLIRLNSSQTQCKLIIWRDEPCQGRLLSCRSANAERFSRGGVSHGSMEACMDAGVQERGFHGFMASWNSRFPNWKLSKFECKMLKFYSQSISFVLDITIQQRYYRTFCTGEGKFVPCWSAGVWICPRSGDWGLNSLYSSTL